MSCPEFVLCFGFFRCSTSSLAVTWLTVYRQLHIVETSRFNNFLSYKWCGALYSGGDNCEIIRSLREYARTLGNSYSYGRIVSKWRILDGDPHDFQRRFQLCPPQVLNPSAGVEHRPRFRQNLEISMKSDFLKSSYMKSRGVKYHPWWLLMH